MKMYYSPASPFARKVLVLAHEIGCADRIELLPSKAHPVTPDLTIAADNPLAQVPTLLTEGGEALFDSRVICEYLDSVFGGNLFPTGAERWHALIWQSLGDGLLDAALRARYEATIRPREYRWEDWQNSHMHKISRTLGFIDGELEALENPVNVGTIAIGCALGYLEFRFADYDWRPDHPQLARWFDAFNLRPSMQATMPHD